MRLLVVSLAMVALNSWPGQALGQTSVSLADVTKSFADKQTATLDSSTALRLNVAALRTKGQCSGVVNRVSIDKPTEEWLRDAARKALDTAIKLALEAAAEKMAGLPAGVLVGVAIPTTLGRCTDPNICSKTLLKDAECERQLVNHTSNIRLYNDSITSKECAREILKTLKVVCD